MAADPEDVQSVRPRKVCFVTIGATASFDRLLTAVLDSAFLKALQGQKYTDLVLQYGKEQGKVIFDQFVSTHRESVHQHLGIVVSGFDYKADGLNKDMRNAKGDPKKGSEEGLVVSHAGMAWILFVV